MPRNPYSRADLVEHATFPRMLAEPGVANDLERVAQFGRVQAGKRTAQARHANHLPIKAATESENKLRAAS